MTNRIASALATWDRYVSDVAQDGGTVDPHAMMAVLLATRTTQSLPKHWEHVWLTGDDA